MVSSIIPGAAGTNVLGADTRYARPAQPQRREDAADGDKVQLTGGAINAARDSVRAGIAQVHEALAAGHDAQATLVKVLELAKGGDETSLANTLKAYNQRIDAAIERGARVVAGETISVQAEPGAAPVTISGVDLRLGGDVMLTSAGSTADAAAQSVQKSMENLQAAMSKLVDAARALEAHQGFLGAAEIGSRGDLDADGARLLALQVRQGLEAASGAPIANAEPQAVLSLFRA